MARRRESIIEILMGLPWWVSVVVSAIAYMVLAIVLPSVETNSIALRRLFIGVSQWAPYVALFFLFPAPISAFNSWRKRRLLDSQKDIQSIRELGWKQFEELVAEAYRRMGYAVQENYRAGADGGVDIRLRKDGNLHLVQCKQWKTQKIGVGIVREMYGLLMAERAASAIVICSGIFTQEAKNFAEGKAIDLVDGSQLESLIGQVKAAPAKASVGRSSMAARAPEKTVRQATNESVSTPDSCPKCGGTLMLRTAKKGANAGAQFWGCSMFPKCRYTQQGFP